MSKFLKEAPSEFNIFKYNDVDKFTAKDWYYAISGRKMIYLYSKNPELIDTDGFLTVGEQLEVLETAVISVINNPLNLDFDFLYTKKDGSVLSVYISSPNDNLAFNDKYSPVSKLNLKIQKEYSKNDELYGLYDSDSEKYFNDFGDERVVHIDQFTEVLTRINPFYSNKLIHKEIDEILKVFRDKHKISESMLIDWYTLQRWASYKLLALMDLYLWGKICKHGMEFSFSSYDRLLFQSTKSKINNNYLINLDKIKQYDEFEYSSSTIRKTIYPIMMALFSQHLFDSAWYKNSQFSKMNLSNISFLDQIGYLAFSDGKKQS